MNNIAKQTVFSLLTVISILNITGCSSSDGYSTSELDSTPQYAPAGWYMKTSAIAIDDNNKVWNHSSAGVFGELLQSDDGKDQHDLRSYGPAVFQVVFSQTEWDEDNGYYFSDYQAYTEESSEKRVWTFQLRHDLTKDSIGWPVDLENADITILLDGTYNVAYLETDGRINYKEEKASDSIKIDALTLIDVDNNVSYLASALPTDLNMDGLSVRTFRWVLGDVENEDFAPLPAPRLSRSSAFNSSASTEETEEVPQTYSKFGLPPQ